MIWTNLQVGGASGSGLVNTLSSTFGSNVGVGNLIVVAANSYSPGSGGTALTLSDQKSNVYTQNFHQVQIYGGFWLTLDMWWLIVPSGSNVALDITSNAGGTATFQNIGISEFSFGGALSIESSDFGNSTATPSYGTASLTVTGSDLLIGCSSNANVGGWPTVGSGFTSITTQPYSAGVNFGFCMEYELNVTSNTPVIFNQAGSPGVPSPYMGTAFKVTLPSGLIPVDIFNNPSLSGNLN